MALTYGRIVGQFLASVTDGPDEDDLPDEVPLSGRITFDLNVDKVIDPTRPVVVAKTVFEAVLDADGFLTTPNADGEPGARGITVLSTDNPVMNPTRLQYRVRYALRTPDGTAVALREHGIAVPVGEPVDLALVMPPDNAPPIGLAAAEAAAAAAAKSAQDAANAGATPELIEGVVRGYLEENPPEGEPSGFLTFTSPELVAAIQASSLRSTITHEGTTA